MPALQYLGLQSVPPGMNPEPSALQVVKTLPLQAGMLGVQTFALHRPVAASQISFTPQVCTNVDVSPLTLHWRDSLPEQNRLLGAHTPVMQVAATQTLPCAWQSSCTVCDKPSAAHLMTWV